MILCILYMIYIYIFRREAKNIKEILSEAKVRTPANDEDDPGSRPCDKDCSYSYCHLLRETMVPYDLQSLFLSFAFSLYHILSLMSP